MDTSDFVAFGAGLAFGGLLSRTLANSFADALDAGATMRAVTIPRTRAEIQTLLDRLDVRLANGELSEATYKPLATKWQARLDASRDEHDLRD